jgi:hypothetical protein
VVVEVSAKEPHLLVAAVAQEVIGLVQEHLEVAHLLKLL